MWFHDCHEDILNASISMQIQCEYVCLYANKTEDENGNSFKLIHFLNITTKIHCNIFGLLM